ncbi:MAG TPA: hypothetical protein VMI32_19670 [Candidatus Solibacter sp.]|nr:hypothetical protein [Candidatus Solibacter sp.]
MKQKHQVMVLLALVVVALLVWSFEWRKHTPAMQTAISIQNYKFLAVDNPQIRWAELERAQKTEYKSNGRNPFSVIAPPTPQQKADEQKKIKEAKTILPPPPPPPPTTANWPQNLKYFGYGMIPMGTERRAFITDGEDVYVVNEGETLLGRYRILKVGNANLEFQEISTGLHGTTPLEEQPGSPSL